MKKIYGFHKKSRVSPIDIWHHNAGSVCHKTRTKASDASALTVLDLTKLDASPAVYTLNFIKNHFFFLRYGTEKGIFCATRAQKSRLQRCFLRYERAIIAKWTWCNLMRPVNKCIAISYQFIWIEHLNMQFCETRAQQMVLSNVEPESKQICYKNYTKTWRNVVRYVPSSDLYQN